jgi:hypothetical protein
VTVIEGDALPRGIQAESGEGALDVVPCGKQASEELDAVAWVAAHEGPGARADGGVSGIARPTRPIKLRGELAVPSSITCGPMSSEGCARLTPVTSRWRTIPLTATLMKPLS